MNTLYMNPASPNCKRVHVAANELGIALDTVTIDLQAGEQQSSDFLSKNPNGKVPTLANNAEYLWESPAILYRLASEHCDKQALLPDTEPRKADMFKWMFWHASHLEPAINAIAFERLYRETFTGEQPIQTKIDENMPAFVRFAQVLNEHFQQNQWVLGDTFSIADIMLGTSLEMAQSAQITFDSLPHLAQWLQRLTRRPSWNAH